MSQRSRSNDFSVLVTLHRSRIVVQMRTRSLRSVIRNGGLDEDGNDHTESLFTDDVRGSQFSFATFLYAVLLAVFLLVEETSFEDEPEHSHDFKSYSVFSFYMYTVGIGFMVYINLFVTHPKWINRVFHFMSDRGIWIKAEKYVIIPASHNAQAVNSLYLRLGVVFFGSMGVVLFGLLIFLLFSNEIHGINTPAAVTEAILGLIFTFFQMYFMNVNYKLSIPTSKNICRFGFMHCFAVNIWTWHRFAIAKFHESVIEQIRRFDERQQLIGSRIPSTEGPQIGVTGLIDVLVPSVDDHSTIKAGQEILGLLEYVKV